jgi:hypothetical protein
MMHLVQQYIAENGFGFSSEKSFSGLINFTRVIGRVILCDQPRESSLFNYPSSKTFWVQQAEKYFVIGLWSGYCYITSDETQLVDIINMLFHDTTISGAPYVIPENFLTNSSVKRIELFSLVKKNALRRHRINESNSSDWYCKTDREQDWLQIPSVHIKEFLDNKCQYDISRCLWARFACRAISGYVRLPVELLGDSCTLQIAIDNDFCHSSKLSEFLNLTGKYFDGIFV